MTTEPWWSESPAEIFWLETTQRPDVGLDLNAPQANHLGREYWSYSLVREVSDGDIVFHYEMHGQAIELWSRAAGGWWEDEVYWGARGTVGRSSEPYYRPGLRHGLDGPFELERGVALDDLRRHEAEIQEIRDALLDEHGPPLYFPFELSAKRPLRTAQGYLFKMPADVVALLPDLRAAASSPPQPRRRPLAVRQRPPAEQSALGVTYRWADEDAAESRRDPFDVDPAVIERGTQGHAHTQNSVAHWIEQKGLEPRSPGPEEPVFDLAWEDGETTYICEVKSLTTKNEERQLRLGLGQVLRYCHVVGGNGRHVVPVLAAERKPSDATWETLCDACGVRLVWPASLVERL